MCAETGAMRLDRFVMFCVIGLALTVEVAAEAPASGQSDVSRPNGIYASLNARDVAACEASCAADGLCLAWTYTPAGVCGLTAIASQPVFLQGARSGLSRRAPEFARQITYTPPPAPPLRLTSLEPQYAPALGALDDSELLGGPEETPEQTSGN